METIRFTGTKIDAFSGNLIAKALFFCSASRAEAFQHTVNTLKHKALGQRDRIIVRRISTRRAVD